MDISTMTIEHQNKCDRPRVTLWVKLHTAEEIDDVIDWLRLAKTTMAKWEEIRRREVERAN